MYTIGSNGDTVDEYDLSTAWDISTAVYLQEFSVVAKETVPQGLFFKPDGTKMYTIGSNDDTVDEYDLSYYNYGKKTYESLKIDGGGDLQKVKEELEKIVTDQAAIEALLITMDADLGTIDADTGAIKTAVEKIDDYEDPDFTDHARVILPLMNIDTLSASTSSGADSIAAPGDGHHLEIFGFILDIENIAATGTSGNCLLSTGGSNLIRISITAETQTEHITVPMSGIRFACANNAALTLSNCAFTGGAIVVNAIVYYKSITD